MRSRTELVTHQLEGSEFEDESDFEDSEEDWRPAKGEQKPKKIKTTGRGRKSAGGNKNGGAKRGRKPSKKVKKQSSDEDPSDNDDDDEDMSEPEPTPAKKPKKPAKKSIDLNDSANDYSNASAAPQPTETVVCKPEPTTSMFGSSPQAAAAGSPPKPQPLQRKVITPVKSFPDKCGYLNLFIFKGDLKDGIVNNTQVCLWRRDGSSLLQKYLRDKTVSSEVPQFNSSMVYSCWEDKRANEYVEVKVRCLEQSKQIRVELTDVDELEAKSKEEYDNYVATYGTPVPRSNVAQQDDDDEDDEGDEDDEDEAAGGEVDGVEGEEYDEDGEGEEVAQEE